VKKSELKRRVGLKSSSGPAKRGAVKKVNAKRRASRFRRNFHSEAFVCFTRGCCCAFCGSCEFVVNGHVQHSRGAGGGWRAILPVCGLCDVIWETRGRKTFLVGWGLTTDDIPTLLKAHHEAAINAGVITRDELLGQSTNNKEEE
jgi:hypothetical protein